MKVLVLYDFVGEPGSSELSVVAGETLVVCRKDVGEGWWEGTNKMGHTGLFPAAYVEEVQPVVINTIEESKPPPALPPPPLPPATDPWDNDDQQNDYYSHVPGTFHQQQNPYQQQQSPDDFYDDEWDDDSEYGGGSTVTAASTIPPSAQFLTKTTSMMKTSGKTNATTSSSTSRFSKSVGSGDASYIMSAIQPPVHIPETEQITIVVRVGSSAGGPMAVDVEWCRNSEDGMDDYQCVVASPKKESKLKGLKSFIAYQITPTFNNIQVSRRYKHFDWLHERLLDKYCCLLPIPPLPDKQISGRYEEHFIERRKQQLQAFVDAVCRHPVLSRSWVWYRHFITCTDEKRWKTGKRKAESRNTSAETLAGPNLFFAIRTMSIDSSTDQSPPPINQALLDREVDGFQKFVVALDGALKNMAQTVAEQSKRIQTCYKRDAQRIGQSFYTLGHAYSGSALSLAGDPNGGGNAISRTTKQVMTALKKTGDAYNEMGGRLIDELPAAGWDSFADMLHVYRGIAASFPDILAVHKSAIQKRKECERQYSDGLPIGGIGGEGTGGSGSGTSAGSSGSGTAAVSDPEQQRRLLREIQRRTDLVSYALLAEINHFHRDHVLGQLSGHVRQLLRNQIEFHRKIADNLENVLNLYPDDSGEDTIGGGGMDYFQQQQYNQGLGGDAAGYQNIQYYANQ